MKPPNLRPAQILVVGMMAALWLTTQARAQYLGVTCGWQYSAQLTGPLTDPTHKNISLYNPQPSLPNATWDDWAEQLDHAGVDFVSPNLTGSQPNTGSGPDKMAPLLTALANRGLTNRIKFAIFDDNAASWVAQWNDANGRGFGYAQKFDMSDTNNWKYLYDYNYKIFYQTIPDANRFKINGRPLLIIWTGNTVTFLTNVQGNASQAITYVRQKCQADFGFNPYIILSSDFFSNDTTCTNAGIADGSESWFYPPSNPNSLTTFKGVKTGVAVASFGVSDDIPANHGLTFDTGLSNTCDAGAQVTLCEGFTDYEEDASMWRVRNLDTNGNSLDYTNTGYDFPNQRLNLLRKHSNWAFPPELTFEAEACDTFGGATGGNGKVNFYRNGNIAIEPTADAQGAYDVGWIQPGEWFEWQQVPIQGGQVHLQARVASTSNNCQIHFVIDGTNYPALTLPDTGGLQTWATADSGPYQFARNGRHTVRLVCDTGGFNLNYWRYYDDLPIGVNISLQSVANGKWVSAAGSNLTANVASPGISELFTVVDASAGYGHGYVALQASANGNFVTGYTNATTSLIADAASVGPAQLFQWTDNGDGTIALRSLANSKLVGTTNNPAFAPLIASRFRTPGSMETFTVAKISTNSLSFVAQPNNAANGVAITSGALGEVQVLALNGSNVPVSGVVVTMAIAGGTGTLTGNSAITDGGGIAHFTNLAIDKVGAKTLQASSSAYASTTSAAFNIVAGSGSALTVETAADGSGVVVPAGNITAGSSLSAYAIVRDAGGNFITNMPAAWSLVNITGGVVGGDLKPATDGRSATFTAHIVGSARIQAVATFTGLSGVLTVSELPVTFSSGTFTDDSVLSLIGTPAQEVYGFNLGGGASETTANGYIFRSDPNTNFNYNTGGTYPTFLSGGGASGDANFDAVLNTGRVGGGSGVLVLSNLTVGATYKALFLEADTRSGEGTRAFAIAAGAATSPSQSYAFAGGTPALGGYIFAGFTTAATTKTFTNTQAAYGYQLNSVLVGKAAPNTPPIITLIQYGTTNITFVGTNGMPGGTYRILTATDVATPTAAWVPIETNSYDPSGAFNTSIAIDSRMPAMYYRLVSP